MSHTIQHDAGEDLIIATVTGDLDRYGMKELISEICEVVKQTGCYRIITDMRQTRFHFSTFNAVSMYEYHGEIALLAKKAEINNYQTIRAFIVNEHDLQTYQTTETIARNRGHNTTLCHDMEQAKNFLHKN